MTNYNSSDSKYDKNNLLNIAGMFKVIENTDSK